MHATAPDFRWNFRRLGGLDQAMLATGDELSHLGELNPKLWIALSCPTANLEFDARTLSLIDTDGDGRIRVPEVLHATAWLTARLKDPADMIDASESMPLERIATASAEGRQLRETAGSVLAGLGKPEADALSHADVAAALETAAHNTFNGDGILPPLPELGPESAQFISDALTVIGGVMDASGKPGIDAAIATAFKETMEALTTWRAGVDRLDTPLGDDTAEVWQLVVALREKIDDYFLRCDMAAFAPWACAAFREEEQPRMPETGLMECSSFADLPLARIEPDRPLSFNNGLNPAWRHRVQRLGELIRPLLRDPDTLCLQDWEALQKTLAPYQHALDSKPAVPAASVTVPPTGLPERLPQERIDAYRAANTVETVLSLLAQDADAPAVSTDIADLERLVLYHAHLYRFLMNFVSFRDFYASGHHAMFQSGTLFLDGRSCRLCLPVADVAAHVKLAALSQLCLVYCQCTRTKDAAGALSMTVVAAVTAGHADMLVEGRNGVFVDAAGRDWDATVVKVAMNPISIRQAIWDPYQRAARAIGGQISKFAASRQADVAKKLEETASGAVAGKAPAFDIGKSMGIFAAIGLALGALGTAVASIAHALFSLAWWQIPLVFIGGFLLISGPSVLLAWVKLRKRNLGPLLEASGWAVNNLVPINLPLGRQLTDTAVLPGNARRSFNDPLQKVRRWPLALALVGGLLLLLAVSAAWVWFRRPDILPF